MATTTTKTATTIDDDGDDDDDDDDNNNIKIISAVYFLRNVLYIIRYSIFRRLNTTARNCSLTPSICRLLEVAREAHACRMPITVPRGKASTPDVWCAIVATTRTSVTHAQVHASGLRTSRG